MLLTSLCDFDSGKWVDPRAIKKPLVDVSDLFGGVFESFFEISRKGDVQKSQATSDLLDLGPIIQPSPSPSSSLKKLLSKSASIGDSLCNSGSLALFGLLRLRFVVGIVVIVVGIVVLAVVILPAQIVAEVRLVDDRPQDRAA